MSALFASDAFSGKRILITGASSGIGRATSQLLSRHGARLLLLGRSEEQLSKTAELLSTSDHAHRAIDMKESEGLVEFIVGDTKANGPLDGMFHAAGIGMVRQAKLTKQQHVDDVFAASIGGAMALARAASMKGTMPDQGGSVLFMSSVAASRGQAGMSVYSASKGAIDAATRSLACELAPRRIRVNSLVAGAVRTEMHERTTSAMIPDAIADYERKHLLGFGEPSDVAAVAAFLLSDGARWVTGASWVVDGGYLAK